MEEPPPDTVFRRTLFEFRRLRDLWRVRIPLGCLNLGGIALGIAVSWDETEVGNRVLLTLGALAATAILSAVLVLLLAWTISPHRILKDRVAALEQAGSAEKASGPPMIQQAGTVNVYQGGTIEPRTRPGIEMGEFELPAEEQD